MNSGNEMFEIKKNNICLNNRTYNLKLFLNNQKIIFQLENNDSKIMKELIQNLI